MSPLMYGPRSSMAFVLRCGECGYVQLPRRARRAFYPSGPDGPPLCDRCAYARGALGGRERARYVRSHPFRAAWLWARRLLRRGEEKA